jgi:carboxyl-terminal processing protease
VDKKMASASEILTAALQDNHRATVVGTRTFGKGRIQNVQELEDGSGISVTKAKYMTPEGRDIHGVGIAPDVESKTCQADNSAADCLSGLQI